jgi:hypothetical protein
MERMAVNAMRSLVVPLRWCVLTATRGAAGSFAVVSSCAAYSCGRGYFQETLKFNFKKCSAAFTGPINDYANGAVVEEWTKLGVRTHPAGAGRGRC